VVLDPAIVQLTIGAGPIASQAYEFSAAYPAGNVELNTATRRTARPGVIFLRIDLAYSKAGQPDMTVEFITGFPFFEYAPDQRQHFELPTYCVNPSPTATKKSKT
jgi:hypothetical protein